jgi:predicted ATP-grasp superfamily ATP-dependent carboligase
MTAQKQLSALVLDSQAQNSLALSRTLAEKGVSVTAGGSRRFLPGMLSKVTDASYVHPDVHTDRDAFVEDLYEHLERHGYDAVFAVSDLMTTVLSQSKARLEETGTPVGVEDWERHVFANDKGQLMTAAADIDVPIPRTVCPESIDDVEQVAAERTTPVVIKPRRTSTQTESGGQSTRMSGSNYVDLDEDLVTRYRTLVDETAGFEKHLPLVQEYIDGVETMATVGLAEDGDLLTHFQHEKFRVYPSSGGIGAVRRGIREPKMRRYTERVVEMLGWTGPIHVEFMRTADGEFYLLEVNGRYWGSLTLTINSGVDVPWFHFQQLLGETPEIPVEIDYRTDVRQRKLFYTDILWLRENLSEGRLSALAPFIASFFTTREEFLTLSDPLPLLGVIPRTLDVIRSGESR